MARKSIAWTDCYGCEITIHDGPAAGTYKSNTETIRHFQGKDGLLSLGSVKVNGKEMNLRVKISEIENIDQLSAKHSALEAERQAIDLDCDRCGCKVKRKEATMRPASIGAMKVKLPYCKSCARFLHETEDGFGEVCGSVQPVDATTYHKEQD